MSPMDLMDLPTAFDLEMEGGVYQSFEAIVIVADENDNVYMALQEVSESDDVEEIDVMFVQVNFTENNELELISIDDDETFNRLVGLFAPEFAKLYPDLDELLVENSEGIRRKISLAPHRVN